MQFLLEENRDMPFDAMPELPAEARIIDAALEILGLEGKNWVQGQLGNKEAGYCVMGAIRLARRRLNLKGDKTVKLLGRAIEEHYFLAEDDPNPYGQLIQAWNDCPDRTFTEVKIFMLKTRRAVVKQSAQIE
jgi:hypothetical protein